MFSGRGAVTSKAEERGLDNWSAGELYKGVKEYNTETFTLDQAESVMRKDDELWLCSRSGFARDCKPLGWAEERIIFPLWS